MSPNVYPNASPHDRVWDLPMLKPLLFTDGRSDSKILEALMALSLHKSEHSTLTRLLQEQGATFWKAPLSAVNFYKDMDSYKALGIIGSAQCT